MNPTPTLSDAAFHHGAAHLDHSRIVAAQRFWASPIVNGYREQIRVPATERFSVSPQHSHTRHYTNPRWLPGGDTCTETEYLGLVRSGFTIYMAAPAAFGPDIRVLVSEGMLPSATRWLDITERPPLPLDRRAELWLNCVSDVRSASVMLLLLPYDKSSIRGALVEAGVALGAGIPVVQVGTCRDIQPTPGGSDASFVGHPLWHVAPDINTGLEIAVDCGLSALRSTPMGPTTHGLRRPMERDPAARRNSPQEAPSTGCVANSDARATAPMNHQTDVPWFFRSATR